MRLRGAHGWRRSQRGVFRRGERRLPARPCAADHGRSRDAAWPARPRRAATSRNGAEHGRFEACSSACNSAGSVANCSGLTRRRRRRHADDVACSSSLREAQFSATGYAGRWEVASRSGSIRSAVSRRLIDVLSVRTDSVSSGAGYPPHHDTDAGSPPRRACNAAPRRAARGIGRHGAGPAAARCQQRLPEPRGISPNAPIWRARHLPCRPHAIERGRFPYGCSLASLPD